MTAVAHIARSARPMAMSRAFRTALAAILAIAVAMSPTALVAQTQIKLPKNKYTPQQDVELGREAAAEVREQYPGHQRRAHQPLSDDTRRSAGRGSAARSQAIRLRVLVHTREPEGDQRLRPAGRSDVREPRDVRRCGVRSRSGRCDGPRAVSRAASSWHGQRDQGAESLAATRPDRRSDRRSGRRRRRRIGHRAGQPVRPRHAVAAVQPRVREAGGFAWVADHGACRIRPARACQDVRDDPVAVEWRRHVRSG